MEQERAPRAGGAGLRAHAHIATPARRDGARLGLNAHELRACPTPTRAVDVWRRVVARARRVAAVRDAADVGTYARRLGLAGLRRVGERVGLRATVRAASF